MAKLTYFPLLMDRWIAGTRHLTFEQKGFYLDLILYLYEHDQPIKNAAHAAQITGCDPRTSRRLLADLSPKFYRRSDGLRHKLVTEILRNNGIIRGLGTPGKGTKFPHDPDPDPDKEKDSPNGESKKKVSAHGSRLPEQWEPSPADDEWARMEYPTMALGKELDKFRDYWLSVPGQRGRKADWSRTWRNWVRKAAEQIHKPKRLTSGDNGQLWQQSIAEIAVQLGMTAKPGETYEQFGARVRGAKARAH